MINVNQADAILVSVPKVKAVLKLVLVTQMHTAVNVTEDNAQKTSNVNMDLAIVDFAMILYSGFLYSQVH
jgi:hypothetical protein